MNNQTQISGDQFGSGGGEMTIAKDQGTVIQIHELHMPGRQQAAQQTIPCHLPPLDEHFVDREQQLAELLSSLHPGKVVTLCGPGGIGKSALAAQAVRQIEPERFPDGILFHSFYQQPDPLIALEYIARSFGVEPKPDPASAARMALGRKRALLILDGAEEADDLRPVLNIRGDCGVLITSRRKQDALACRQDIPPLAHAAAAELLQAWGGSQLASAALTPQLCERLGGWPLAIRLAGHYVNESGETASEYLQWLETQPIEALDHGDHRDSSINVLLRRSVEQVSEKARQALAVVGQLAFAPLSVEPIAAALGCEMRQCRTAFAELVNYGLLQRTDDRRYEVSHAFIHTYARTHLPLEHESVTALAKYYQDFASTHSRQGPTGYVTLDAERTHIMQILETCQEQAQWEIVSELVEAVTDYLDICGYWAERQAALEIGLIAAQQQGNRKDEGRLLNNLGCLHTKRGDYATALTYLEQSLAIRREIGDIAGMCATLFNMGHIYHQNEDVSQAFEAWVAVYRLAKPRNLAQALDALENLAGQLGLPGGLEAWEKPAADMMQP